MRPILWPTFSLAAVVLIAVGCNREGGRSKNLPPPPKGEAKEGLAIGNRAPEITGVDADGRRFALSDYRGKVVLLDFWFEK
jgi:cytochrome oxidase Cu insertion factor (SCO1/SenC/PrrC family)